MTLSIECQLLESVEQRTRSGAQPFRTLTEHLGRAPLRRDAFVSRMVRFLPGASPAALCALFSRHACDGLLLPETFARRVVSGFEVGGGLAPAPRAAWQEPPRHSPPPPAPPHARVDGVPRPREARGVADAAGADVGSRGARRGAEGSEGSDGATPPSAGGGLDDCARVGLLPALVQAREAVERRVAELGRRQGEPHGGLPAAERVTLHASRAHTAACQLAVLRLLRAAAPLSATLTPAQLAAALAPLRRHAQAGTAPTSECPPLLLIDRPALLHALTQLTGGRIEALVEQLAPSLPPPPSAPPPPYGPAAAVRAEGPEAVPTGETVFYGPFDRGSGRKGEQRRGVRRVDPPAVLPTMMKYRFCRTPLLLPAAFDPALITRSARRPSLALRRAFVYGYNGLGRHNRSPNVFESHDGRLVFSVASLGVVMDVSGKDGAPLHERQTCFDGHTDDVTCIAVHRTAERTIVATGQLASTSSHGVEHCPWLAVWELSAAAAPPRLLARVGWVPDDRPGAHDKARRPFYSRSVCAAVFSADGKLLFAIGSDDQSTLGVWAWQTPMFGSDLPGQIVKGQLLAHGPTFREAPLAISQRQGDAMPQPAVHQIVVAPQPLSGSESSTAPFNTDGAQLIAVVGASGLPKFGALSGSTRANSMGLQLAFKSGQLGKSARGVLPKALSAVLFGGRHFAAPSGAAHGLTFIGSTDGRIFIFDAPRSLAALRALSAHQGAITVLCSADDAIASGGSDGRVRLWRGQPAAPFLAQDLAASASYERELALHVGGGGDAAPLSHARTPQGGDSRRATEKGKSAASAPPRMSGSAHKIRSICAAWAKGGGETYPQLYVGTSRCSILQLGGRGGGEELIAGHFDEATGVAAHPSDSAVWASCGADRQLLLWHRSSPTPAQRTSLRAAASCLTFSPDAKLLAVGHVDGTVSLVTTHPTLAHRQLPLAHCRTRVEAVAFSPDGARLACAGHDRLIEISLVAPSPSPVPSPPRLVPLFVCRGHTASVLHLDWSADSRLLMSDCAAHEILCWAVPRQQPIAHAAAKPAPCRVLKPATQAARLLADSSWASWTCVLGFPVMGIWPDDSDGTDVNAVHRSAGGGLVLSADDFGEVKLFNSPCVVEDAPFHVGTGHSSHVSCVRFLEGDFAAVSAGSKDRAVILWQLEKAPEPDRLNPEPILLPDMPRRGFLLAAQPPPPTKGRF